MEENRSSPTSKVLSPNWKSTMNSTVEENKARLRYQTWLMKESETF